MLWRNGLARIIQKRHWESSRRRAARFYAAIIREIANKGDKARFKKTDRGLFELSPAARE